MKVGVVGNMNNGMFALTRHLRDRGIEAELFFAPGFDHFHPKADTMDLADLAFCHQISWLHNGFRTADPDAVRTTAIRREMSAFDALVGTGDEAAALSVAGVPLQIYFPYGDDVVKFARRPPRSPRATAYEVKLLAKRAAGKPTAPHHRYVERAISHASHVILDWTNQDWDEALAGLPLEGKVHRSPWPMLHPASYRRWLSGDRGGDVHWRSAVDQLRTQFDFLLLYHGRHEWTRADVFDRKNTHHLLHGFAQFVREHPDMRSCLVTVEYGTDVGASKRLISELALDDSVRWFPLMFRKDLMYLVNAADLCCGEFGRSYLTFGTVLEAMSLGKLVVHHRDDSLYNVPLYPVLNAREPAEIAAALDRFVQDRSTCARRGRDAQAWVDEYVVSRPLDLICSLLRGSTTTSPSRPDGVPAI